MSERRPPGSFSDDTAATPLIHLASEAVGPRRPCLLVVAGARLGEIFPIEHELVIGRDPEAQIRLPDDEGVSRRHARVTPAGGEGALIADLGSANGVWVDGERVSERMLTEGEKVRIGQTTILKFARYDAVEEAAQRQLLESALRDGLTRAFNRRYFQQRLTAEVRFADRHQQPLTLLMIDLDHFKEINDRHGHFFGDNVLRKLVETLASALRAEDVLARWGGEEFVVLARGISSTSSHTLAERLRRLVADGAFGKPELPLQCTISVGVAAYPSDDAGGDSPEQAAQKFLGRADAALYRAKQAGRNRISD